MAPLWCKQILNSKGDTAHIRRITTSNPRIGCRGLFTGKVGRAVHKRVQRPGPVNRTQTGIGQFNSGEFTFAQAIPCGGNG